MIGFNKSVNEILSRGNKIKGRKEKTYICWNISVLKVALVFNLQLVFRDFIISL